jgi:hypothetical protein
MDARLTTLLCKEIPVPKSKEVKTGWFNSRQIWRDSLGKDRARKGAVWQWWWWWWWWWLYHISVWLNIGLTRQPLVEVSHIEVQNLLDSGLGADSKSFPFCFLSNFWRPLTNPIRSCQRRHCSSITKSDLLMLFGETLAVYSETPTWRMSSRDCRTTKMRYALS